MTLSQDQLRLIYDGQLKKMLAYIAVEITSFAAQLTTLIFLLGQKHAISDPWFTDPFLMFGLPWAGLLWFSQCYLLISIVAKFQEIVVLEKRLGITQFYSGIREDRFHLARVMDQLTRKFLRIEAEVDDRTYARRQNRGLNFVTIMSLAVLTGLFICVVAILGIHITIAFSIVAVVAAIAIIEGDP